MACSGIASECNNLLHEYRFVLHNIEKDFIPRFREFYGKQGPAHLQALRACDGDRSPVREVSMAELFTDRHPYAHPAGGHPGLRAALRLPVASSTWTITSRVARG
jgi:hypothetical protein